MSEQEDRSQLFAKKLMNPSLEHLIGAMIGYRKTLDFFRQKNGSQDNLKRIEVCEDKLREVELALFPEHFFNRKKVFLAWSLLHQVCEDLFLMLNRDELLAEGKQLLANIKMSALSETAKKEWVPKLEEQLKRLEASDFNESDLPTAQNLFKMSMVTLNNQVDTLFWDIWSKKFSGLIYTLSLISGLAAFAYIYSRPYGFSFCIGNVLLLGALGGVASGILTSEPQYLAKGHFWVSTFYYALVRPAQGALAALIMFWLVQSQYLITIDPAVDCKSVVFSNYSCSSSSAAGEVKQAQKEGNEIKEEKEKRNALIVLNAAKGKQAYLLMLLLLMAGFSGDKLLKSVSDKVTSRLFTEAEKTKEAPR